MTVRIEHDEAASRYVVHVDGEEAGFTEYHRDGERWVFDHTVIESDYSGRGLAGELVGHALDEVVGSGGRIVPVCSYVASFIDKHPEYQEHVAG